MGVQSKPSLGYSLLRREVTPSSDIAANTGLEQRLNAIIDAPGKLLSVVWPDVVCGVASSPNTPASRALLPFSSLSCFYVTT